MEMKMRKRKKKRNETLKALSNSGFLVLHIVPSPRCYRCQLRHHEDTGPTIKSITPMYNNNNYHHHHRPHNHHPFSSIILIIFITTTTTIIPTTTTTTNCVRARGVWVRARGNVLQDFKQIFQR